jgi:flagellar biosynthesis/type III secretory pathway chaperone
METIIDNLLNNLENQIDLLKRWLTLLGREKRALMTIERGVLSDIVDEQKNLADRFQGLQKERLAAMEKLRTAMGMEGPMMTLAYLCRQMVTPKAERMTACIDRLSRLNADIRNAHASTGDLIAHSLGLIQNSRTLLDNLLTSRPVYHRDGQLPAGRSGGRLLCGQA